jgi:predicted dehydrogenase
VTNDFVPAKIAVIGAGAFGRFCIEAYAGSSDVQVVLVVDPDPGALAQVDSPGARLALDWKEAVHADAVEVVHVATPPFMRREIVEAAFAAGKSVFCEKPLALSLAEADAMIGAAERCNLVLGVNYVMRHLEAYRLLERVGGSGILGELRTISFENFAQQVPRDHWFWDPARGGGVLVEHGVHFFDAYGRVAGPPASVWGSTPRPESVDVGVSYQGGAFGRFYHEFAYPKEVERASGTCMFEHGHIVIEGWIPTRMTGAVLGSGEEVRDGLVGLGIEAVAGDGTTRFDLRFPDRTESYRAAVVAGMRDVLSRHRNPDHQMTVSPQDARDSLALALAAQRGLDTGEVIFVATPSAHPGAY